MSTLVHHDPIGFSRFDHQWESADSHWQFGHGLLIIGTPTQAALDQLAADISSAFVASVLHRFSSQVTLKNGKLVYSTGFTEIVGTSTVNLPGTGETPMAVVSNCMVVSIRTGDHYRGGHGRMYLSGLPRAALDSDRTWDAGAVGEIETDIASYLAAVDALTGTDIDSVSVGVIHRFLDKVEKDPHTFSSYTGTKTQRRVCSQRRRLGALL